MFQPACGALLTEYGSFPARVARYSREAASQLGSSQSVNPGIGIDLSDFGTRPNVHNNLVALFFEKLVRFPTFHRDPLVCCLA